MSASPPIHPFELPPGFAERMAELDGPVAVFGAGGFIGGHLVRHLPGSVSPFQGIGQHELSTQEPQQPLAALAGVGWHAQGHPMAPGGRELGQGDARVAAGGVQQGPGPIQKQAAVLHVPDHPQRGPVFD